MQENTNNNVWGGDWGKEDSQSCTGDGWMPQPGSGWGEVYADFKDYLAERSNLEEQSEKDVINNHKYNYACGKKANTCKPGDDWASCKKKSRRAYACFENHVNKNVYGLGRVKEYDEKKIVYDAKKAKYYVKIINNNIKYLHSYPKIWRP